MVNQNSLGNILAYGLKNSKIRQFLVVISEKLELQSTWEKCFLEYYKTLNQRKRNHSELAIDIFLSEDLAPFIRKNNLVPDTSIGKTFNYKDHIGTLNEATSIISGDFRDQLEEFEAYVETIPTDFEGIRELFLMSLQQFIRLKMEEEHTRIYVKYMNEIKATNHSDMPSIISRQASELQQLANNNTFDEYLKAWLEYDNSTNEKGDSVRRYYLKTGFPTIDNILSGGRGLWGGQVILIAAATGVGKTVLTRQLVYNALTVNKVNVRYDSFEAMSEEEEKKRLAVLHAARKFGRLLNIKFVLNNSDDDETGDGTQTPLVLSKEEEDILNLAYADLFDSGSYGKVYINRNPISLDEMENTIPTYIEERNIKVWAVDYMGKIKEYSDQKFRRPQHEIIKDGFDILDRKTKSHDFLALAINQLSAEGTAAVEAGKRPGTKSTMGGMAPEQSSNYVFIMAQTEAQKMAGFVTLHTNKHRDSEPLPDITMVAQKAVGIFTETQKGA